METKRFRALTVRQPWASLIIWGLKHVENRGRQWHYRGSLAIHAGATMTDTDYVEATHMARRLNPKFKMPLPSEFTRGALLGCVNMTDCVTAHPSPFFVGPYGYVMADAAALTQIIWMAGKQGVFFVDVPIDRLPANFRA